MQPLSLETSRLDLRWLTPDDAAFILALVNDPDWIRFIGDKSVTNLAAARNYLETGPLVMYRRHGFGLNRVALKADNMAIGICGILQRENLAEADLTLLRASGASDFTSGIYSTDPSQSVIIAMPKNIGLGGYDLAGNELRLLDKANIGDYTVVTTPTLTATSFCRTLG